MENLYTVTVEAAAMVAMCSAVVLAMEEAGVPVPINAAEEHRRILRVMFRALGDRGCAALAGKLARLGDVALDQVDLTETDTT